MNDANEVTGTELPYMELGGGFVLGLFLGFFFKTFKKNLQAVIMGLIVIGLLMMFFDYQGLIKIDELKMEDLLGRFIDKVEHFWVVAKEKFEQHQFEGGASVLAGFLVGSNLVTTPKK